MGCTKFFSRQHSRDVLQEEEINSTDVSLGYIANDLLLFLYEFKKLDNAKKEIEKQYGIEPQEHNCWTEDDIKKAWKETKTMDKNPRRRRHWAHAIMLQIVKRLVCDTCKQNAAQKNRDATTVEQGCETTPNSEDTSSQSIAELETAGAAGGVEQMLGEENKLSKASRPTESDSGVASGSPLSASSTDEAPSPAEVNPVTSSSNSETRNAGLVNENEDTTVLLVKDCGQSKNTDCEPCSDVHDKENVVLKTGISSAVLDKTACGKAKSEKGSSNDKSARSSAELEREEAAGGVKRSSRKKYSAASESEEAPKKLKKFGTTYIRIPLTKLFLNEPTAADAVVQNVSSPYKLIDEFPSGTDIRKRKSYTMSFNNVTKNAEWVYEILNSKTLKDNCKTLKPFGPDYHKGHLAAAANHRWCREANNDTYLFSNIVPQHKKLNQSIWKTSENLCREKAEKNNVHVYSGPIYKSVNTGNNVYTRVCDTTEMNPLEMKAIPTHLFKVIIVEYEDGTVEKPECYMMPNEEPKSKELIDYKCEIEYIEKFSGLTFIKRCHNAKMTDHIKSVTLNGKCGKGKLGTANIKVRISS